MGDDEQRKGGIEGFGISFGVSGQPAKVAGEGSAQPADGKAEAFERGPFRIAVISDLNPGPNFSTGKDPGRLPLRATREGFDELMRNIGPAFAIDVEAPHLGEKKLRVDLHWDSFKALRPARIVDQVPLLRYALDARRVLAELQKGAIGRDEARAQVERMLRDTPVGREVSRVLASDGPAPAAAPSTQTTKDDGELGGLLSKVALPDTSSQQEQPGGASSLISAVARGGAGAPSDGTPAATAIAAVEQAFGELLDNILQHPETQRLERAWRGLRLLVERADEPAGVQVDVVSCRRDAVADVLGALAQPTNEPMVDLAIVDQEVSAVTAQFEELAEWSKHAEQLRAPVVVQAHPTLVGVDRLSELSFSTRRHSSSDDPRAATARALSARDEMRWICLAMNPVLARPAYTSETSRLKEIAFAQRGDLADVFVNPGYVIGALCSASFARFGFGSAVEGSEWGMLKNLPVHEISDRGHSAAVPLEVFISTDSEQELARCGIAALSCARNHDSALLSHAPMFYRGEAAARGGDGAPELMLSDQLFVGRISAAVEQLAAAIPKSTDPKAVRETVNIALAQMFSAAPPVGPQLEVEVRDGDILAVTVQPRRFAGVRLEEFTVGARMG